MMYCLQIFFRDVCNKFLQTQIARIIAEKESSISAIIRAICVWIFIKQEYVVAARHELMACRCSVADPG